MQQIPRSCGDADGDDDDGGDGGGGGGDDDFLYLLLLSGVAEETAQWKGGLWETIHPEETKKNRVH